MKEETITLCFLFVLFMVMALQLCVYAVDDDRNPFASELPRKKVVEKLGEVAKPSLAIQGIVWQTSMPQAIINNRVIKEGDYISEDIKVIDISKEGVIIEHKGYSFFYSSGMLSPIKAE